MTGNSVNISHKTQVGVTKQYFNCIPKLHSDFFFLQSLLLFVVTEQEHVVITDQFVHFSNFQTNSTSFIL